VFYINVLSQMVSIASEVNYEETSVRILSVFKVQ
jgi:hypothetical protein